MLDLILHIFLGLGWLLVRCKNLFLNFFRVRCHVWRLHSDFGGGSVADLHFLVPFVSGLKEDAFSLLTRILDEDEIVGDVFEFLIAINFEVILIIFHILRKACCLVSIDRI